MADRKRQKKKTRLRLQERVGVAVLSIVLIACVFVVGAVAYLQREAKLVNTFETGIVETEVQENFDGAVKSNVFLKNTGTVDEYLRAKILIYYEDNEGNIVGEVPAEGMDYQIDWGDSAQWLKSSNGYYYYAAPVKSGDATDVLIQECRETEKENRHLVVDILAEAIQAEPTTAVEDAWESQVSVKADGTLELKQQN